ncbi:MAG: hypothetical protein D0433_09735 [Candidatus Thermochlorobacter aerophilum]|jgi:hypothetical protein|uniref:Uncharacterized protein n=1 Tax=Candidatus Thermochlorobacter aerophilus TaxID=1868324 RepID=A0A395LYY8_9BACT|nr:MAG: hypothetical protein D0433_09735 [Candidatus Thermochlorobacter aerophilum]
MLGAFTRINAGKSSIAANYVARFNTSTNTWSILGTGNGVDGTVNALSIVGSEVYLSGYFTHADILSLLCSPIVWHALTRLPNSGGLCERTLFGRCRNAPLLAEGVFPCLSLMSEAKHPHHTGFLAALGMTQREMLGMTRKGSL